MVNPIAQLWIVESTAVVERERVIATLPDHLAYQDELERRGILFAAGPVTSPEGKPTGRGLIILRTESEHEAREIADNDPMHQRGLRSYQLSRWSLNEGIVRKVFE